MADIKTNQNKMVLVQEEPRGPSQLIEIQVTQNGLSSITLPVIMQLISDTAQTIIVKGLRLVTLPELAVAPQCGLANAPLTELQKISLLLYAEGWQKGKNIPILALNDTFTEGSGIPFRNKPTKLADWQRVDWNKSELVYSNGQVVAGAPYAVIFEVDYVRYDNQGKITEGPSA